jgi:hypothetical protein
VFFTPDVEPQVAPLGAAAGLNLTDRVHDPEAGTIAVQLFVMAKSEASPTLALATLSTAGLVPVFFTVNAVGAEAVPASWLPKLTGPGGATDAETGTDVPLSEMACGLWTASSVSRIAAVQLPACCALKVALIKQLALGPRVAAQLLVCANSTALAGETAILLIAITALPVLVKVIPTGALASPTVCVPKATSSGFTDTSVEAMPVPESTTVCGLPFALSVKLKVALTGPGPCGVKSTRMVQAAPAATEPLGSGHA